MTHGYRTGVTAGDVVMVDCGSCLEKPDQLGDGGAHLLKKGRASLFIIRDVHTCRAMLLASQMWWDGLYDWRSEIKGFRVFMKDR